MCVYERKRERKKPSKLLMTPVHTETARGIECETEAETVRACLHPRTSSCQPDFAHLGGKNVHAEEEIRYEATVNGSG